MVLASARLKLVLRSAVFVLLVAACGNSEAQRQGCSYGSDTFSENAYRVSGASCQLCRAAR